MDRRSMVVVMGDLARSPRMQYHCISLAKHNYHVTVIANKSAEDRAFEELESSKNIRQQLMRDKLNLNRFLPSILTYLIKPIWQSILLMIQLLSSPKPHVIIVQNPPSIPTLPILCIYRLIFRCKLIIDWHNYGFSILSLKLGTLHLLVRLMKYIELTFGRMADAGFCVSEAMKSDLRDNYNITYPLYVLYDRPPKHFKPLSVREKHDFFLRVQDQIPEFKSDTNDYYDRTDTPRNHRETRFTITDRLTTSFVKLRPDRPAIILSSTSWTEDEDFDVLLSALTYYNGSVTDQYNLSYEDMCEKTEGDWLPKLVCVITGKGPLKEYYKSKIKQLRLDHVDFVLPWLSAEHYPRMVGSCDIGISLHSSSSGVDLPMKVVDLFGCGIPVLAYKYKAINELVIEDHYGRTFENSHDLFLKLSHLLKSFYLAHNRPTNAVIDSLERFRGNISGQFRNSRWEKNWKGVAKPVFDKLFCDATGILYDPRKIKKST